MTNLIEYSNFVRAKGSQRSLRTGALAVLLTAAAWVAPSPRPARADAAPGQPAQAVPHRAFTLDNGLRVILQEDHHAPFVTVCVVYHAGAAQDPPGKTGLAHVLGRLMFRGSGYRRVGYQLGAIVMNAKVDWHRTLFYETVPTVNLESALWMEADRMRKLYAADDREDLDKVRDLFKSELRQDLEIEPYSEAAKLLESNLFPAAHPYSQPFFGSMQDLDTLTTKDTREFYNTWYKPYNATLVLVGDLDAQLPAAQLLVMKYFSFKSPGVPPPVPARPDVARHEELRLRTTDAVATAPMLQIGWVSPPRFSAEDGVGDIVAEIAAARLRNRLIKVLGLASHVSVQQESRIEQSIFRVKVVPRSSGQLAKVLTLTDAILEELRQDTATEQELERARLAHWTRMFWELENPVERAGLLAYYSRLRGTADWFRADLLRYQRAKLDDIGRFSRDVLRTEARVVIEVAPGSVERP